MVLDVPCCDGSSDKTDNDDNDENCENDDNDDEKTSKRKEVAGSPSTDSYVVDEEAGDDHDNICDDSDETDAAGDDEKWERRSRLG